MHFVLMIGWSEPWRGKRFGFFSWQENVDLDGARERAGYGLRLGYFYISVGRDLVDG
jgi:hypothetical protein